MHAHGRFSNLHQFYAVLKLKIKILLRRRLVREESRAESFSTIFLTEVGPSHLHTKVSNIYYNSECPDAVRAHLPVDMPVFHVGKYVLWARPNGAFLSVHEFYDLRQHSSHDRSMMDADWNGWSNKFTRFPCPCKKILSV